MIRLFLLPFALWACGVEDAQGPASRAEAATPPAAAAPVPEPNLAMAPIHQEPSGLADRYDFENRLFRADLPNRLDEISGLAMTAEGRLFAHDDERGRVHLLDPGTGEVGKRFDLGDGSLRDDFEGIAVAGERFFLVSSRGSLYEFREADDDGHTPYHRSDTGLGTRCEVEGLDYLEVQEALLFACKVSTADTGAIVLPRIPLDPEAPRLPPITIARSQLRRHGLREDFEPSAVAVSPVGTLVLVSATQESLIEVDLRGEVLSAVALSRGRHPQSEGLAFGSDGTLYVSDEQNGQDARLTAYGLRPTPSR